MIVSSLTWIDYLTAFVAVILPLVNGFLTSRNWSPAAKGISLALLALVFGVSNELLTAATAGEVFDIGQSILKWGLIFITSVVSYFGILSRPIEKNGVDSVASKVARHGVK